MMRNIRKIASAVVLSACLLVAGSVNAGIIGNDQAPPAFGGSNSQSVVEAVPVESSPILFNLLFGLAPNLAGGLRTFGLI